MAVFEYNALNMKGNKISGIIDAESQDAAEIKLRKQNIFLTSLIKLESKINLTKTEKFSFFQDVSLFARIKSSDLALITKQLSTLLSAGFPLVNAVATLIPQIRSKALQKVLSRVKDSIEQGNGFAESLSLYPKIFPSVYINMINAGENSGTLEIVLERLAEFTEKKEDTKKKIQAALAYPVLMSIIGIIVLTILLTYVVPGIIKIFSDMHQILPFPTRVLIGISSFFEAYWYLLILLPIIVFFSILSIRKTHKGAYFFDWVFIFFPVLGSITRKLIAARVTRTLASLLANGVPMLPALKITKSIAGNIVLSDLISKAAKNVEQGGELGVILEQSKAFPYLATQMIKVGEKSGKIEKMLENTADLFEKDVETKVTAISSLVTPIIILIMGVVVALIIFAICLPIFEINQLIR